MISDGIDGLWNESEFDEWLRELSRALSEKQREKVWAALRERLRGSMRHISWANETPRTI